MLFTHYSVQITNQGRWWQSPVWLCCSRRKSKDECDRADVQDARGRWQTNESHSKIHFHFHKWICQRQECEFEQIETSHRKRGWRSACWQRRDSRRVPKEVASPPGSGNSMTKGKLIASYVCHGSCKSFHWREHYTLKRLYSPCSWRKQNCKVWDHDRFTWLHTRREREETVCCFPKRNGRKRLPQRMAD